MQLLTVTSCIFSVPNAASVFPLRSNFTSPLLGRITATSNAACANADFATATTLNSINAEQTPRLILTPASISLTMRLHFPAAQKGTGIARSLFPSSVAALAVHTLAGINSMQQ